MSTNAPVSDSVTYDDCDSIVTKVANGTHKLRMAAFDRFISDIATNAPVGKGRSVTIKGESATLTDGTVLLSNVKSARAFRVSATKAAARMNVTNSLLIGASNADENIVIVKRVK